MTPLVYANFMSGDDAKRSEGPKRPSPATFSVGLGRFELPTS
jgi:hypothetical protein